MDVYGSHGFVHDLTHYLCFNNQLWYIEGYVQQANPHNIPLVIKELIDVNWMNDLIEGLILEIRYLLLVQLLANICKKHIQLRLLMSIMFVYGLLVVIQVDDLEEVNIV
jgi:hypothetical protein